MRILFVHQNFPGQFRHLAAELARRGHQVAALTINRRDRLPGIQVVRYQPCPIDASIQDHPLKAPLLEWHAKLARAAATARAMRRLCAAGFVPDVVVAHPGWGEALLVRDVFPRARMLVYAEYFYGVAGGDVGFDPEFPGTSEDDSERLRLKNTHLLHALNDCDEAVSPTHFQKQRHPAWAQQRIRVIHDGIDTDLFRADPSAAVQLRAAGITLQPGDEVITFAARQLEPYRGYHIFMRALPQLLQLRPRARVVIVGGEGTAYGAAPPAGRSWKQVFLQEVVPQLDMTRIHFVGQVPHPLLTSLMQVSRVHVYLTYPFVLSWSLLEAMSIGCLVVGSDTAPVREVIEHGRNGLLTDFFDPAQLAVTVAHASENHSQFRALREAARASIVERFDLRRTCLPAQLAWIEGV